MKKILRYFIILLVTSFACCEGMDLKSHQENRAFGLSDISFQIKIPNSDNVLVAYQKYKLAVVSLNYDNVEVKRLVFKKPVYRVYNAYWINDLSARDALFQSVILDIQISLNSRFAAILLEKENSKYVVIISDFQNNSHCQFAFFTRVDKSYFKSMWFTEDSLSFIVTLTNGIALCYRNIDGNFFAYQSKKLPWKK